MTAPNPADPDLDLDLADLEDGDAPLPDGEQTITVDAGESGTRLDVLLGAHTSDISRASLQRLVEGGNVTVNGAVAKSSYKVQAGDTLRLTVAPPRVMHVLPQAIPIDVVYEDDDLLIVNKAKGMVVHPAPGAEDGTLVNALLARAAQLSQIGGELRPGIVHRLDKDTSGLMMVAKNDRAHHLLQTQIQARTAKRRYLALVWGSPDWPEATIDVPIARHPNDRKRMSAAERASQTDARDAVTEVYVRERLGPFTLWECRLQTGRTHQIRVHAEYAGFPVVGDPVYSGLRRVGTGGSTGLRASDATTLNDAITALHGQLLHAYHLSFDQPTTGERLTFETAPPPEMADFLTLARDTAARQR